MSRRSAIVRRGAICGTALGAAPLLGFALPALASHSMAAAVALLASGAVAGGLPGLAVGTTLALSGPATARATAHAGRAALAAGAAFLAECVALVMATAGPAWIGLGVVGTPLAAALGAGLSGRTAGRS